MILRLMVAVATAFAAAASIATAHASYMVVTPDNTIQGLDVAKNSTKGAFPKRSHIIVSGRPSALGENLIIAALAQGLRLSKLYPDEVVVLYLIDTPDYDSDGGSYKKAINTRAFVQEFGFKVLEDHRTFDGNNRLVYDSATTLNAQKLLGELLGFHNIASLHSFSHAGIDPGVFLDSLEDKHSVNAWQPFDATMKEPNSSVRLADHFTIDAYTYIHGCNGGHVMAWWLSQIWGIPVAGNFTTAHFEVDDNARTPGARSRYRWTNKGGLNLKFMKTMRMKSDDVNYTGFYGKYAYGLPIYKFFCSKGNSERCQLGMARSVFATVTTVRPSTKQSPEDYYKEVVREYLCPSDLIEDAKHRSQAQCIEVLERVSGKLQGEPLGELQNYMPYEIAEIKKNEPVKSLQCMPADSGLACYKPYCYANEKYKGKLRASACAKGDASASAEALAPATRLTMVKVASFGPLPMGSSSFVDEYIALINALQTFRSQKLQLPPKFVDVSSLPY